eukprot:Skav236460  [mRNA]  locus=scaffold1758:500555:505479:- [translate_table: standard]
MFAPVDGGARPGGLHLEQCLTEDRELVAVRHCVASTACNPPSWWPASSVDHVESFTCTGSSLSGTADTLHVNLPHRSSLKGSRGWNHNDRISFDPVVRVKCVSEQESVEYASVLDMIHVQNRAVWHLHGQVCDASTAFTYARAWSIFHVPEVKYGGVQGALQEAVRMCTPSNRHTADRPRLDLSDADITIVTDIDWSLVTVAPPLRQHARRQYVETWYLAHRKAHVCIHVIEPHATVTLIAVTPKPHTFPATIAHVIVFEGELGSSKGIVLSSDNFAALSKHRAILVLPFNSVQDIFRAAQYEHMCGNQDRPCYVEDLAGHTRKYATYEVPRLRQGAHVEGGVLVADDSDSDPDQHDSDDDHESDTTATDVPDSDDPHLEITDTEQSEGDQQSHVEVVSPQHRSASATSPVSWMEVPTTFKVSDVLGEGPNDTVHSWMKRPLSQHDQEHDSFALMQRNRSRSRDPDARSSTQAHPDQVSPGESSEHSESNHSSDAHHSWSLVYSNMPEDPAPVAAGDQGPSTQAAELAIGFPAGAITNIYPVRSLAQLGIDFIAVVECRDDHVRDDTEVSILFDIVAQDSDPGSNPAGTPHKYHSHHIARRTQTHASFTGIMGLSHFFRSLQGAARVYHNGEWWDHQDVEIRHLQNGDHVEVVFAEPLPHDTAYATALSTWIQHQGLELWPSLLRARQENISQTLPFVATDEPEGQAHTDELPHIIVEQGHRVHQIALLVTERRHAQGQCQRTAFSVQDTWSVSQLLHLLSIDTDCLAVGTCQVTHEGHPVVSPTTGRRPTGQAITVHQHDPSVPADETDLMQRAARLTQDGMLIIEHGTGGTEETSLPVETPVPRLPETGGIIGVEPQPTDQRAIQHLEHLFTAFSTCSESWPEPTAYVATYLLIPGHMDRCAFSRTTYIGSDASQWKDTLLNLWKDNLDPSSPVELFVVLPQPPQNQGGGPPIAAFVILMQHRTENTCPALVTLHEQGEFLHIAQLFSHSTTPVTVIMAMGLTDRCLSPELDAICVVSQGATAMEGPTPTALHPGTSLVVGIFPLPPEDRPARYQWLTGIPPAGGTADTGDVASWLQTTPGVRSGKFQRPTERLIAGAVAQAQQPGGPGKSTALRIAPLTGPSDHTRCVCHHLTGTRIVTAEHSVHVEVPWSHSGLWQAFSWRDRFGCKHVIQADNTVTPCVVYVPLPSEHNDATRLMVCPAESPVELTDQMHMKFLYKQGFMRSVIHPPLIPCGKGVHVCYFSQQEPALESKTTAPKEPTPWPARQYMDRTRKWPSPVARPCGPQDMCISLPCSASSALSLLSDNWIILRNSTEGYELSEEFVLRAPNHVDLESYDRLVICTDGSSAFQQSTDTHVLSWAFVVVGENYNRGCDFLGWAGGKVCEDHDNCLHISSTTTHSTRAEKEALLWATLWRITQRHAIPTAILSDSSAGLQAALGSGGSVAEEATRTLRGAVQTLQVCLPDHSLCLQHTKGHAGQYWNELADRLATVARTCDLPELVTPPHPAWKSLVPHLNFPSSAENRWAGPAE